QADVFMTAIKIAGYTWEVADKFRKAVGKKIPSEMQKQKDKFIAGAIKNGMTAKKAGELFSLIEPFSGYGFNKAHAASYGMLAYETAYMKANFPIEYMTALLTAESKDTQKITSAINECKRMGIKILPPDINESDVGFTIIEDKESLEARAIRFGLDAIKNVGKAAIDSILEAREFGKFLSLNDFCSRIDARRVNKKVLESLIKVGGMTQFGARAALLSAITEIKKMAKPVGSAGQQDLFSEAEVKANPREIIRIISDIQEFSQDELQQLERSLLGFSLSARPLTEILGILENLATHKIFELSPERPQTEVVVAGVLTTLRIVVTKKSGSEMAFAKIEDETGVADLVIFPKIYSQYRGLLLEYKPLLISGKIDARDENSTIVVDEIRSKEDVESKERELLIKIPAGIGSDSLIQLKKLLLKYPGKEKVSLVFEGVNKKTMPLAFGVSWDEKLSRLISEALNDISGS
ncbi:MAG: OB-fold nucleic acid binding domain-containing protein, partial [Patescibacteria group bacterium]